MAPVVLEQGSSGGTLRPKAGLAVLSGGFRPFFLLASLWAALAMVLWLGMLAGRAPVATAFDPFAWHAHEFMFGYVGAVVAGFVLTAVPNWTRRPPLRGLPLALLVGLWLAGRAAVALSALLPWQAVALTDLSLPLALLLFLAREVIRARNWRNLPVIGLIGAFGAANAVFHLEAAASGPAHDGLGLRLGLATTLMLIVLIGGRIIPAFTRNWLSARGATRLPAPFARADAAVLALTALSLAVFVVAPGAAALAWLMPAAAVAHLWRLSRWCGWQVRTEPLLWVLHLAYLGLALGFAAETAARAALLAPAAALHLWLAGAIGLMTLGVMCRATLGHTGHPLRAGPATTIIFLAAAASTLARLVAGNAGDPLPWLQLSAALWVLAFGGFFLAYAPALLAPRPSPSPISPD